MRKRRKDGTFDSDDRVVAILCGECGLSFQSYLSRKRKFCSRKCYTDSKKVDLMKTCEICGSIFEQRNSFGRYKLKRVCSRSCFSGLMKSIKTGTKNPHSPATRRKMSDAQRGAKHHNWKGGTYTKIETEIRHSPEYKSWRKAVFARDDWTCQACGQRGGELQADHELPFAHFPDLRFEVLNGRTLCKSCHKKTDTYGGGAKQWLSPTSPMRALAV